MVLALAVTIGTAGPARADAGAEQLEVYTGTVTPVQADRMRASGLDVEGAGAVEAVLTRRQADRLAARGVRLTPRTVRGERASDALRAQARAGWTAYRSYSEPGGLRDELTATAARYPNLAKVETIGRTVRGKPILAVKVTADARRVPDGKRPAVLYAGAQHAREWITPEMVRRLYHHVLTGYGADPEITRLLDTTELWFLPVANPDGYDHTFTEGNRLWRKNLRDNDGDGRIAPGDGVDLNRNFGYRWGYDDEGSSGDPAAETYRGAAAASEPETRALDGLFARVGFEFFVNYHSAAQLLLYGVGWQVATPSPDDVIYRALAGDDAHPAVPGYDPDLAAELYTTNGDTDSHAAERYGTLGFTPEMSTCKVAADSVPDDRWRAEDCASDFIFPDDERLISAEFTKNVPFALAVAAAAKDPALTHSTPDLTADPFAVSYGTSQPVAVTARRGLKRVALHYRINGGTPGTAPAREWTGGERYGTDGTRWFTELRGTVPAQRPGDRVEVWFSGEKDGVTVTGGRFGYTVAEDIGGDVLLLAAEDVTGTSPDQAGTSARYAAAHAESLGRAGFDTDVYDVDARGRTAPHHLGVLSHYRAVVWETGDDVIPRAKGQPNGTTTRAAAATELAVRDYLNEGGKLLAGGQHAFYPQSLNGGAVYHQTGPGECTDAGSAACIGLSNDFLQYWLGAYTYAGGVQKHPLTGTGGAFRGWTGTLDDGQKHTATFLSTRGYSHVPVGWDRPGAAPYGPATGDRYVWSGRHDAAYQRLSRRVTVPAGKHASLRFATSYDIEKNWDFLIVEARRAGTDEWTTLPEAGGRTSTAPGESCPVELHPELGRYLTEDGAACASTGRWHAATGASGGWQRWTVDLSGYAGSEVEVAITYVTDWGTTGLGVFVDDATVMVGGSTVSATSFEDGLAGWTAPEGWTATPRVFEDGAVVTTPDTVLLGFGLEGLAPAARDDLVRRAMTHLKIKPRTRSGVR
ncbi:M14 family metallopeptidase [Catenuloplanes indicus JCM 9534]